MGTKAGLVMAKKKQGEPTRPAHPIFSIRGSSEWKAWVDKLADHVRLRSADLIDQALVEYAKTHGFEEKPPKR